MLPKRDEKVIHHMLTKENYTNVNKSKQLPREKSSHLILMKFCLPISQPAFTCSKLTIETVEQDVK